MTLLGAALLAATPTRAGDPRGEARKLADEGIALSSAGKYAEASERFRAAEKLFPAPTITLELARSCAKAGKLVAGREAYTRITSATFEAGSPPEFLEAQSTARTELDALASRVPSVQILIDGAAKSSVKVTLDGVDIAASRWATPLWIDPGTHAVTAAANGKTLSRSIVASEGGFEKIELAFVASADSPNAGPSSSLDESQHASKLYPALPVAALVVGVVGIGVGAVTGMMALGTASSLKDRCPANQCAPSDQSDADKAHTLAHVSTAAFIVGGVGLAAGGVLFLTLHKGASTTHASSPSHTSVWVGPGSLHLGATF